MKPLLVVHHSRSGSTLQLRDAILEGAAAGGDLEVRDLDALVAGPDDVLAAGAVVLASPTNFGWVAGLMKDFLERIYRPCLEVTRGRPFGLAIKGDTDVDGGVASVEKIVVAGLGWRPVHEPVKVVGPVEPAHLEAAWDLGATVAAGLLADLW